ncbi:unnamed protein product [Miscanthus lutarioriparius]|uniref:Alpha/beta hydrolase fold-3 domain-containing protein n=1 Tax=Miscanthus lutarioriparius TaxID=422564 RepID=A0A811R696_9POAL|nr:unnamed protein product [Miscanthus lutarioriparius]
MAYDDDVAALRYLDANADSLPAAHVPVDLSSCFLVGDSAGGNITHHVSQRWAAASASASLPANLRITGAVLIQPFFGGEERTVAEVALDGVSAPSVAGTDHYWREFLPEGATWDHEAARVCGEGVELADALAMPPGGGFHQLGRGHAGEATEADVEHGRRGLRVEPLKAATVLQEQAARGRWRELVERADVEHGHAKVSPERRELAGLERIHGVEDEAQGGRHSRHYTGNHLAYYAVIGSGGGRKVPDVQGAQALPERSLAGAVHGEDVLKDWQARYVEELRGKGKPVRVVEYPDAVHGFHAFPELADSGKFVEEINLFVQDHSSTNTKRAV